ncbi:MAG: hypothetical protein C0510_00185 [Erythrobacter sp.]|nr:hypothetical protein [Erythrobacter sp.]MBA4163042.1 hypothetical protein [Erythrobacter sp.]
MEFRYLNYRHKEFSMPEFWPDIHVEPCTTIHREDEVLRFFERFNNLLAQLTGYTPAYRPLFKQIGVLEGVTHIRYFRADTGKQYVANSCAIDDVMDADEISNCAFMVPQFHVHRPRSIRPIRIKEGEALHVAVDADFEYWGWYPNAYDPVMLRYTADII